MAQRTLTLDAPEALTLIPGLLTETGQLSLIVSGDSMWPVIRSGEAVTIVKTRIEDVATGDIVLIAGPERLKLHRFVARTGAGVICKGDNLPACDPVVPDPLMVGRLVDDRPPKTWHVLAQQLRATVRRLLGR